MIKAVFLDWDGTAYSHSTKQIPQSTLKAIKLLKKNGILSFLCTGRSPKEMTWFDISELEIEGSILTNGQIGTDKNNNIIFKKPIEGVLKDELVKIYNEKKIAMYFGTIDDMILNFEDEAVRRTQNAVSSPIPHVMPYNGQDIFIASAFSLDPKNYKVFYDMQEYAFITNWGQEAIDVVPKNSTKSSGVDEMIKHYGIDISETMGFGDGNNDIDFLEHCGIGVAMGSANDNVKAIADHITTDIDDDGVYNALKHFDLI